MSNAEKNFALDWTRRELDETLKQARLALEAYSESRQDKPSMRACVTALHQVHGTLLMLDLGGVSLLSEELEQLAQSLLTDSVSDVDGAQQILMQGILQLPGYLERIQRGGADSRGAVLPLANEVRLARGAEPFADAPRQGEGFSERPVNADLGHFDRIDGVEKLRRIRAAYQQLLLAILRGEDRVAATKSLQKVAVGLERVCAGTPHATLWRSFGAFVRSVGHADSSLDGTAVKLLRRVDAELKRLSQGGRDAMNGPVPVDLLASLILAARSRGLDDPELDALADALDGSATIPGAEALQAAAVALREELAAIKDQLDLSVRAEAPEPDELKLLVAPLQHVGSTLGMLGLDAARAGILEQVSALAAIERVDQISDVELLGLAATLLELDETLLRVIDEQGRLDAVTAAPAGAARSTVLSQAREGLEHVKQAVVGYVSSHWESARLRDVPSQLSGVAGALRMIDLLEPADMTDRCRRYVDNDLLAGRTPDWQALDTFADAISGIDYYLERLSEGSVAAGSDILELIERSLTDLENARGDLPDATETISESSLAEAESGVFRLIPEGAATDAGTDAGEIVADTAADADANNEPPEPDAGLIVIQAAESEPTSEPERTTGDDSLGANEHQEPHTDDEITAIFLEEVGEILDLVDTRLLRWAQDPGDAEALAEIRRAFHTLKGSSRTVGAQRLGELARSIENMLNGVNDGTAAATAEPLAVVRQALAVVRALAAAFGAGTAPDDVEMGPVMERADLLASGGRLGDLPDSAMLSDPDSSNAISLAYGTESVRPDENDTETLRLFVGEASMHIAVLEQRFEDDSPLSLRLDEDVMRALHTLRGSSGMPGMGFINRIAAVMNQVGSAVYTAGHGVDAELWDFFRRGAALLRAGIDAVVRGEELAEDPQSFEDEGERWLGAISVSLKRPSLLDLGGAQVLFNAGAMLDAWRAGHLDADAFSEMVAALYDVRNEAESLAQQEVLALCDALLAAYDALDGHALDDACCAVLTRAHELLLTIFDRIAAEQDLPQVDAVVDELRVLEAGDSVLPAAGEAGAQPQAVSTAATVATASHSPEDGDAEILALFNEEAYELLESVDQSIHDWARERSNRIHLENLLRALHTLKGGARLAGLSELGDATHAFESFLTGAQDRDDYTDSFFDDLQLRHDELAGWVARIRRMAGHGQSAQVAPSAEAADDANASAVPALEEASYSSVAGESTGERDSGDAADAAQSPRDRPQAPRGTAGAAAGAGSADVAPIENRAAQEMVRVSASLLDQLVNVAGESSIVRSRIEQGINDFAGALDEMEMTIDRVREQLRRLEIQTEAQVLFRSERAGGPEYEEFDPLEMDRYSHLQQLSRALAESASDMLDLKETLTQRARESETLLLQQARLNTELQEGLMRTRMVPFSRLVPRLRRIVRQIAQELGKSVELHTYNVDGELDRNVLERMVPPLEHMLRNAVDHGVEPPDVRRASGKPATGRIELKLSRQAADVVIEIEDDGAGIDASAVRAKAVERGLLEFDSTIDDEAVLQFIFAPGFSTATSITQISGRGVGMDVVHTTVKQLGGSIAISAEKGVGTRFSIQLPFTVSVNRALMVAVADDLYAVPLNTIEGIVRVPVDELREINERDGGCFEYAGAPYRLRYLGHYLGREYVVRPDQSSVPLVLVRSGDLAIAVHVDAVQGSREIVVKSLGPQFAGVGGISGATVLGDGSVVVILDLIALVRSQAAGSLPGRTSVPVAADRPTCVMVVDDSVTVRKVTSRLLERQGMDVIVAKDGVEAIALLQEQRPDIMLLDIEMPRMDGFEVARQVRRNDRLARIPIVMVSSRTGSKHQERAMELDVDRFIGKPFQETELLRTIDELVVR
jgi:chemosensory pili system protein ChpA (sensor histidine kinase/response regulator)